MKKILFTCVMVICLTSTAQKLEWIKEFKYSRSTHLQSLSPSTNGIIMSGSYGNNVAIGSFVEEISLAGDRISFDSTGGFWFPWFPGGGVLPGGDYVTFVRSEVNVNKPQTIRIHGSTLTPSTYFVRSGKQTKVINLGSLKPLQFRMDAQGHPCVSARTASGVAIVRFDEQGNQLFAHLFADDVHDFVFDNNNNMYVMQGTLLMKFASNGAFMWNYYNGRTARLTVDVAGNAYLSSAPHAWYTSVLRKISPGGKVAWEKTANYCGGWAVTTDGMGNLYEAASMPSTDQEGTRLSLLKYDPNGNLLWNLPIEESTTFRSTWSGQDMVVIGQGIYLLTDEAFNDRAWVIKIIDPALPSGIGNKISNNVEWIKMDVFPNPSHSLVSIILDSEKNEEFTLSVIDLYGKQIITKKINKEPGSSEYQIDLSGFARGSYEILVESNKLKTCKKIMLN